MLHTRIVSVVNLSDRTAPLPRGEAKSIAPRGCRALPSMAYGNRVVEPKMREGAPGTCPVILFGAIRAMAVEIKVYSQPR